MSDWDAAQYRRFEDDRTRPSHELLARVPLEAAELAYDLGCGPGNSTELIVARYPKARVIGVDSSPAMLEKAAAHAGGGLSFRAGNAGAFAESGCDVVLSNAALHWLPEHTRLFPRLVGHLRGGGVLAVQMPRNHGAPSHTEMCAAAQAGGWRDRLGGLIAGRPVAPPESYYDLLAPHVAALEVWETEYLQVLEGAHPVVEWTKGSALRPLLEALEEPDRSAFLADYTARVDRAYPRRPDGRTLFPFRRLFLVATAPGRPARDAIMRTA